MRARVWTLLVLSLVSISVSASVDQSVDSQSRAAVVLGQEGSLKDVPPESTQASGSCDVVRQACYQECGYPGDPNYPCDQLCLDNCMSGHECGWYID